VFQSAESNERQLGSGMQSGTRIRPDDTHNFQLQLVLVVAASALPDREPDLERVVGSPVALSRLLYRRHIVELAQRHRRGYSHSRRPAGFPKGPSIAWTL
jgi:hypothetical protein